MIKKVGIDKDDALDAYSDAIVELIHQVQKGNFKGESKLTTYFYRIFYFKCIDIIRKDSTNQKKIEFDIEHEAKSLNIETQAIIKEDFLKMKGLISSLGDLCNQILMDWGYWGFSMEEIAERTKIGNAKQIKDRKYNCMKKLKTLLNNE